MSCIWQLANKMAYVNGCSSGYTVLCCDCSVACPLSTPFQFENWKPIANCHPSNFRLQTSNHAWNPTGCIGKAQLEDWKNERPHWNWNHGSLDTTKFQTRQNQNNKVEFEGTSDITDHCLWLADSIVSIDSAWTSQFQMLKSQVSRFKMNQCWVSNIKGWKWPPVQIDCAGWQFAGC